MNIRILQQIDVLIYLLEIHMQVCVQWCFSQQKSRYGIDMIAAVHEVICWVYPDTSPFSVNDHQFFRLGQITQDLKRQTYLFDVLEIKSIQGFSM